MILVSILFFGRINCDFEFLLIARQQQQSSDLLHLLTGQPINSTNLRNTHLEIFTLSSSSSTVHPRTPLVFCLVVGLPSLPIERLFTDPAPRCRHHHKPDPQPAREERKNSIWVRIRFHTRTRKGKERGFAIGFILHLDQQPAIHFMFKSIGFNPQQINPTHVLH